MVTASGPPDDDAEELARLRARAFGVGADIADDPAAMARLAELEGRRPIAAGARHAPSGELEEHAAAPAGIAASAPARGAWRASVLLGAVVLAVGGLVVWVAVQATAGPPPDATLVPDPDAETAIAEEVSRFAGYLALETDTLVSYGDFRGAEIWRVQNGHGHPCLMAVQPATSDLLEVACAPPGAELRLDLLAEVYNQEDFWREGLVDGSLARFVARDDAVDVWLYPSTPER
ncbi:hypothetical protein [Microbacterium terricola]|uniref:Uncharacterized protein n=1 Tax=Microbacterium terricola TaxID=344163 RepID=A0ABM8DZ55_9MICO|nr:hypothetical protein [Microbacterium terricola]UYK41333.1 hypothetical protein OAU46_06805 [Microbacterium terricola]BDV30884.1 hypothetical protein Microterr_15440 [Microbacterium terricola]